MCLQPHKSSLRDILVCGRDSTGITMRETHLVRLEGTSSDHLREHRSCDRDDQRQNVECLAGAGFRAYGKALKETVEVLDETAKLFAEKVAQVV